MSETVAYFEIDGQAFIIYSELCCTTTSSSNHHHNNNNILSNSLTCTPSTSTTTCTLSINNDGGPKKNNQIIKLTLSDGQNMFYNHNDIHFKPSSSTSTCNNTTLSSSSNSSNTTTSNEFNLFQIVHSSLQKQDLTKFKYRFNYLSNGNINFIISMIVNPTGDYILTNIELTKSVNTKTGHLSLFRYLINCKESDDRTIQKLSKQSKHYSECIEQSQKVIDEKDKMERELYSQFIVLLNSKKEAIRKYNNSKNQMEELLEREREVNRKLSDEMKKVREELELLKKQQANKSNRLNQSSSSSSLRNGGEGGSDYQTPRKQSKNLVSFEAEDLLEDLSFE